MDRKLVVVLVVAAILIIALGSIAFFEGVALQEEKSKNATLGEQLLECQSMREAEKFIQKQGYKRIG